MSAPNISRLRSVAVFVGKSVAFTVLFWTVWLYALRPIFYGASDQSAQSAQVSDDALRARLSEQADRADAIQSKYEEQLKAGTATLKRQQELLDRWQKVIEQWERFAPKSR